MDDLDRLNQGQSWVIAQLCFTQYKIARLEDKSHDEAVTIATKVAQMYLDVIEQTDTQQGDNLFLHVMDLFTIFINSTRDSDRMN